MNQRFLQIRNQIEDKIAYYRAKVKAQAKRYWPRLVVLLVVAFLISQKDLSINFNLNSATQAPQVNTSYSTASQPSTEELKPMNVSLLSSKANRKKEASRPRSYSSGKAKNTSQKKDNLANTYSNMTYDKKGRSSSDRRRAEKRKKQLKYVERYGDVAKKEMAKFGIPASITLAQGLLESNVGESKLATRNNNHFGMKCFSRSCKKGHCSNFTDDSHKDFFRKYNSSWESYRAHSFLLKNGKRYSGLFKLKRTDYKGWARGLKKAGYATDKYYAEKLINLIEDLDLHKYDR